MEGPRWCREEAEAGQAEPGAPGAYLAWNSRPDKTQDVFPQGRCERSRDLAGARDLGLAYSHQVTDLPEARAETTQRGH